MQDFIVLGLVPGTHIQLTFQFWLEFSIGFFSLLLIVPILRSFSLRLYIASRRIAHTIDTYELVRL